MVHRTLAGKASELLEKFPLLAITGPRQSGKTTLARQLKPDYTYVNLELDENRQFATEDPQGFLARYRDGVILAEIQNTPSLFPYLKHHTDLRNQPGEYILTGSQHFLLLEKITQSLAGRVGMLQLLPFSFTELLSADLAPAEPNVFMYKGCYPRIYDKDIQPSDFYPAYIQTYVERDVRTIVNVTDLRLFRQFLAACAGRAGHLVNFHEIGNVLGIDSKTVKSWIGILEASFIVFLLPPYFNNFNKRIVKSPKLYFYDTGVLCALLNIQNDEQLNSHFARGQVFENMVIIEVMKQFLHHGIPAPFSFWQDSNKREIDLLIEYGARLHAIEIKSGQTLNSAFLNNLNHFRVLAKEQPLDLSLIYAGETSQTRNDIRILPWNHVHHMKP